MVQRQPRHRAIGVPDTRALDDGVDVGDDTTIGERHALRHRGRPAGELQDRQPFGVVGGPEEAISQSVRGFTRARRGAASARLGSAGSGNKSSRKGAISGSTTTSATSAFAMRSCVCCTNSSMEPSRIGRGNATTVAPARNVAWIAVTSGREVGPRMPTCVPGPIPRAWSTVAIARASSWRRDHSTRTVGCFAPAEPTKVTAGGVGGRFRRAPRRTASGLGLVGRREGYPLSPPAVPVGDAPRWAGRPAGPEITARGVGHWDERDLRHVVGDPEQLRRVLLAAEVEAAVPRDPSTATAARA